MAPPKKELQLKAALILHQQGWPLSHISIAVRLGSDTITAALATLSREYTNTPLPPHRGLAIPSTGSDLSIPSDNPLYSSSDIDDQPTASLSEHLTPVDSEDGGRVAKPVHKEGENGPLDDFLPEDILQRSPAAQSRVHKAHLALVRDLRLRVTRLVADLRREGGGGGRVSPAETVGKLVAAVDKLIERERQLVGLDTLTAQAAPRVLHLVAKISGDDGAGSDRWRALASAYADGAEIVTAVEDRVQKS